MTSPRGRQQGDDTLPPQERCRLVLVANDDPLVAEAIADVLETESCEVIHTQDFDLAYLACFSMRPAVLVLDQIEETEEGARLLRRLDRLAEAPRVVVLRYEPGPVGAFSALHVSVLGGKAWYEELPDVVRRAQGLGACRT